MPRKPILNFESYCRLGHVPRNRFQKSYRGIPKLNSENGFQEVVSVCANPRRVRRRATFPPTTPLAQFKFSGFTNLVIEVAVTSLRLVSG
jgi:hypothetical protein